MRMLAALNLQQNPQVNVRYGESFDSETYKLLEVDEQLLQELLENGLNLKGGLDDEAVLCTLTSTYAVKFVSTSNTVLLVPPREFINSAGDVDCEDVTLKAWKINGEAETRVVATAVGHVELVEISPKLENLKALLSQRPYKEDLDREPDVEEGEEGLYTWEDLLNLVQASEFQLRTALKALKAVEIGKYWRVIDDGLMQSLLEILILTAVQHDWPLEALPGLEAVRLLKADYYPPEIVMHCLETFGSRTDCEVLSNPIQVTKSLSDLTEEASWALDEKKVCRNYGKQLLATNAKWKLEDFLEAWQKVLPSGMNPDLHVLRGEVLVDIIGPESWLHPYSISSLPRKPEARFAALFKRRPKWEWEDLEPYLMDLKEPNQSVEAMLLKYTRKTHPTSNSSPIYTAR